MPPPLYFASAPPRFRLSRRYAAEPLTVFILMMLISQAESPRYAFTPMPCRTPRHAAERRQRCTPYFAPRPVALRDAMILPRRRAAAAGFSVMFPRQAFAFYAAHAIAQCASCRAIYAPHGNAAALMPPYDALRR